ncbi:hypothetical protein DI09_12p140 [Mitosporidium daphniae]|uniref:Signal peptidase complex subunit 3 n=1 Tax=Mitosporidium daphniae TaxID=1485682 RepID=A0A098VYN4_9MICR|nr:uncharacterized protein DI09_12p140 [Mitosporidium daphniae]KGG52846.1 hypothetical protein DI09_12p140 [Mitosporidium daphniae]|eukprot:XP_013239273.1 uncharacterized protein DI09_12p140 [Mitosporidium daphniae]
MHHILSARGMLKAPPNPNVALSGNGKEGHYVVRTTDLLDVLSSLDVDLRPLFNWNVKEVFAFLVVEYESTRPHDKVRIHNEHVLWDRVIVSENLGKSLVKANSVRFSTLKHRFRISNLSNKYPIADINNLFRNNDPQMDHVSMDWRHFPQGVRRAIGHIFADSERPINQRETPATLHEEFRNFVPLYDD